MKVIKAEARVLKVIDDDVYMGGPEADARRIGEHYFVRSHLDLLFSTAAETVVVRLETDDGIVGWGEALTPIVPEAAFALLDKLLLPQLLGEDPLDQDILWHRFYGQMRTRGYGTGYLLDAMAAVDIALWDIRGKAFSKPISALMGGQYRDKLWCYVSGLSGDTVVEQAQSWVGRGHTALKLKLGYSVERDAEIAARVRASVGQKISLSVDVHWKYTVPEAMRLGRSLEALGYDFFEAPVATEDLQGLSAVAQALDIAVGAGEEYRTRYEFLPRFRASAVDLVQPDVGRSGLTEARKIADLAEAFHLPIAPHIGMGLGLYTAATIQFAAAIPNFHILEFQPVFFSKANRLLRTPLSCADGYCQVPQGPGLGVEPKPEAWEAAERSDGRAIPL